MKPNRRMESMTAIPQRFIVAASLCVASHAAQAAPADCYLSVGSFTYLDGPCNIDVQTDGSFSIGTGETTRSPFFAYVFIDAGGKASASWNAAEGSNHADADLGAVTRQGGCWVNTNAKVCAWRPGTRPKIF
jgi:hypothetical protein